MKHVLFRLPRQFILSIVSACCLVIPSVYADDTPATSTCSGSTGSGALKNGVQLPWSGANYESYSWIGHSLGRTYVHSTTRQIILNAYKNLETEKPNTVYKYAETGFKEGGMFKPHKTHQNGLSVDFMTPVRNAEGESVHLPTHALNKFGYDIEFNKQGQYEDYHIDFEAMGAHIIELHRAALKLNVNISRVILDPELQPLLFKTKHGSYLKQHVIFSTKKAWVRHDEHYHVDFSILCR